MTLCVDKSGMKHSPYFVPENVKNTHQEKTKNSSVIGFCIPEEMNSALFSNHLEISETIADYQLDVHAFAMTVILSLVFYTILYLVVGRISYRHLCSKEYDLWTWCYFTITIFNDVIQGFAAAVM